LDGEYNDKMGNYTDYWFMGYHIGLPDDRPWYEMFTSVTYIMNVIFVAVPYSLLGIGLILYNVIMNIFLNDGWAGANMWLIFNTVFLAVQWIIGLLTIWEIELAIFYCKFLRWASLIAGGIYMAFYIAAIVVLVDIVENWDHSEIEWATIYTALVISYNLILHFPVNVIFIVMFIKEVSMEFFQFANNLAGTELDDWSLGVANFANMFVFLFDLVNPWWWMSDDPWFWE